MIISKALHKKERKRKKGINLRESDQLTSEMSQSFPQIHEEKILAVEHPQS